MNTNDDDECAYQPSPAVRHNSHVGVTDTRMCKVYEDLADARFGCLDLFDLGGDLAWLIVDECLMARGNIDGGHIVRSK